MEEVWVCRLCGSIDPTEARLSRCPACGTYVGLVRTSREDAEARVRRRRRREVLRRVCALGAIVLVVGVIALWLGRFFGSGAPIHPQPRLT